ncbi:hypothetical protein M3J09_010339 [Ascochyta lentis]
MAYYHQGRHCPHGSQRQLFYPPYYDNYGDALMPLAHRAAAYDAKDPDLEENWEGQNSIEKATRAHVDATREHEKVKEKLEEAKKRFKESEAKVKEAAKKLYQAKKFEYNRARSYW